MWWINFFSRFQRQHQEKKEEWSNSYWERRATAIVRKGATTAIGRKGATAIGRTGVIAINVGGHCSEYLISLSLSLLHL